MMCCLMTPGLWQPVEPPLPVKINIMPTLPIYCTIKFYDVKHRYIRYTYYSLLPTLSFQIIFVKALLKVLSSEMDPAEIRLIR